MKGRADKPQREKIRVRDVYDPEKMFSLIVSEEEPIEKVIRDFAAHPDLRGIFVVDGEKKFVGVITRHDLLTWARFRIGVSATASRAALGTEEKPVLKFVELVRFASSTKARHIVHRFSHSAYVRPDDDILKALELMMSMDLIDIPVVDEEGRVLGDLKLSEILARIVETQT